MSFIDTMKRSLGFDDDRKEPVTSDYAEEILDNDFYISPEQPFYEIILIRPKSMDDMDYIFDQIIEERNPVIVDLGYLENEGLESYKMAGEKIKILREEHKAEAILLAKSNDKNMLIITPSRIKIIKKE
ncbi:MAG: cell division protein SepF [Methanobrevibacter sp.]|nr:cell division protein SepF [Methanobrevibacter sp.]